MFVGTGPQPSAAQSQWPTALERQTKQKFWWMMIQEHSYPKTTKYYANVIDVGDRATWQKNLACL